MKIFKRKKYLSKIVNELGDLSTILFLIGSRQVGKTSLLQSLVYFKIIKEKELLLLNGDEIINYNLDDYDKFVGFIKTKVDIDSIKYLIIDEAQYINNIGIILKVLIDKVRLDEYDFKIIVSGSGSLNVFKGISDTLTGRKNILKIYPFSFEEFLEFKGEKNIGGYEDWKNIKYLNYFEEYIIFGGYPKVIMTNNIEKKHKIFYSLLNDYIFRDVTLLLKEKEIIKFREFLKIIASKVGTTINITSLIEELGIRRGVLEKYLFVVENTFLLEKVEGYVGGKAKKEIKKKFEIFFNDIGMLRFLLGVNEWVGDLKGKVIENFVFNELNYFIKDYEEIYFWQTRDKAEVDFVIENKIDFSLIPIEVKSGNKDIYTRSFRLFLDYYEEKIKKSIITTQDIYKKREYNNKEVIFCPYVFIINNFE